MRTIIQWLKHDGIPAQAQARGSRIVKRCRRVKQSISIQENFHQNFVFHLNFAFHLNLVSGAAEV